MKTDVEKWRENDYSLVVKNKREQPEQEDAKISSVNTPCWHSDEEKAVSCLSRYLALKICYKKQP